MKLIRIEVDEYPVSCWTCKFKYSDDIDIYCPLMSVKYYHVDVTQYKKSRHENCVLTLEKQPKQIDVERAVHARDDCDYR